MGSLGEQPKIAHGQRLLPNVIDERAISNYHKPFMSIPAGEQVIDGQRDISYGQIANAINRSARWIVETLGKPEEAFPGVKFPPIATYMYPMDFRHPILTLGAIKSGYKVRKT